MLGNEVVGIPDGEGGNKPAVVEKDSGTIFHVMNKDGTTYYTNNGNRPVNLGIPGVSSTDMEKLTK